jgi:RNA methyltransferase, TrmH family
MWESLTTARGIKKHGLFLLSGEKLLAELFKDHTRPVEALIFNSQTNGDAAYSPWRGQGISSFSLPKQLFDRLDVLGTGSPIAVLPCASEPAPWSNDVLAAPNLEVLLGLQDPGNLGSAIRTATAFGVRKITLLQECASPYLPKAVKASAGAVLKGNFFFGPSIKTLNANMDLYALDGRGSDLETALSGVNPTSPIRILLGEEGQGLPTELKEALHARGQTLRIPISQQVESLNATVALAIALYEIQRVRRSF